MNIILFKKAQLHATKNLFSRPSSFAARKALEIAIKFGV
jgi:hypothetical protein